MNTSTTTTTQKSTSPRTRTNAMPIWIEKNHWHMPSLSAKRANTFYDIHWIPDFINYVEGGYFTCNCYDYGTTGNTNCKHCRRMLELLALRRKQQGTPQQEQEKQEAPASQINSLALALAEMEKKVIYLTRLCEDNERMFNYQSKRVSDLETSTRDQPWRNERNEERFEDIYGKFHKAEQENQRLAALLTSQEQEHRQERAEMQMQIDSLLSQAEQNQTLSLAVKALVEIHESRRRPKTKKVVQEIELILDEDGVQTYLVDGKFEVVVMQGFTGKIATGCNCKVGKISTCEHMKRIEAHIQE